MGIGQPAGMSQAVTPPYATTGPGVQTRIELELDDDVAVVVVDVVLRFVSDHRTAGRRVSPTSGLWSMVDTRPERYSLGSAHTA